MYSSRETKKESSWQHSENGSGPEYPSFSFFQSNLLYLAVHMGTENKNHISKKLDVAVWTLSSNQWNWSKSSYDNFQESSLRNNWKKLKIN